MMAGEEKSYNEGGPLTGGGGGSVGVPIGSGGGSSSGAIGGSHHNSGGSDGVGTEVEGGQLGRLKALVVGLNSALFVCGVASLVEFASAADSCNSVKPHKCGHGTYAFAIAVGVVSAFLCFGRLIAERLMKTPPHPTAEMVLSIVLLLLWIVGAGMNTRTNGVFHATENGYFATWMAFLGAAMYAASAVSYVSSALVEVQGQTGLVLIFIAALVEMAVAADVCNHTKKCDKRHGVAVAIGTITFILSIVQFLLTRFASHTAATTEKFLSALFVGGWAVGAGMLTSTRGPFSSSCDSANGYFSTWAAFAAALYYSFNVHFGGQSKGHSQAGYSQL